MCIPNISKDSFPYPELIKGFLCLSRTYQGEGREGFQRATAKPFGRARRRETLCCIQRNGRKNKTA